jgi:hypothetical protein
MKSLKSCPVVLFVALLISSCHNNTQNCINTFPFLANGHTIHYSNYD